MANGFDCADLGGEVNLPVTRFSNGGDLPPLPKDKGHAGLGSATADSGTGKDGRDPFLQKWLQIDESLSKPENSSGDRR